MDSITVGAQNLSITQLGVWDQGSNGLSNSHAVGLWSSATQTLLGSVTVPAGTGATVVGEFRYVSLNVPVTLVAGSTYVLAAVYAANSSDAWIDRNYFDGDPNNNATFSSAITGTLPLYQDGSSLIFPTITTDGNTNAFGVANAIYGSAIPEPSTYAIIVGAFSLAGAIYYRRKHSSVKPAV